MHCTRMCSARSCNAQCLTSRVAAVQHRVPRAGQKANESRAHTEKESLKNDHATSPHGLTCPVLLVTFRNSSGSQSDASDELVAVAPLS